MQFETAESAKEAVALLGKAKGEAYVLAGGTDLLVRMKLGLSDPALVVDIKRIPELQAIKEAGGGWTIGAAVSGLAMGEHKGLGKAWPGVVEATRLIGSDQIQARCTMAGNLCNASPAADSVPAMIAAGAKAVLMGKKGRRTLAVEDVCTGPGATRLAKDEIILAITLPKRPPDSGDAYLRFIPRTEMDIAVVSAGVSLTLKKGQVSAARVALGAVAPTALLVPKAADAIIGTSLDDAALDAMAAACRNACKPIDDKRGTIPYRTKVAGVLAKRAARIAYARAGGAQ